MPAEGASIPASWSSLQRFAGRAEVVLADTIGVATPSTVQALVAQTGARLHATTRATRAELRPSTRARVRRVDPRLGGSHARAPPATSRPDVGISSRARCRHRHRPDALIAVSEWLEGVLGRRLEGYVYRAGNWP
jgi:hypothetical protein